MFLFRLLRIVLISSGIELQDYQKNFVTPIQLRVCNILRQCASSLFLSLSFFLSPLRARISHPMYRWINDHFSDFENNEALTKNIKLFCDNTLVPDGYGGLAASITNLLTRRVLLVLCSQRGATVEDR
jgi:hypothetical protein